VPCASYLRGDAEMQHALGGALQFGIKVTGYVMGKCFEPAARTVVPGGTAERSIRVQLLVKQTDPTFDAAAVQFHKRARAGWQWLARVFPRHGHNFNVLFAQFAVKLAPWGVGVISQQAPAEASVLLS